MLLAEGDRPDALDRPRVGVVGTRAATPHGLADARELGAVLARAGVTVVSGLAIGIDGAAHEGALDAGGTVVGVVATGLDVVYPIRHGLLHRRVREQGLLVSEYRYGTGPHPSRFPVRNRIIAGLSDVLVVVEATIDGGARITADQALGVRARAVRVPGVASQPVGARHQRDDPQRRARDPRSGGRARRARAHARRAPGSGLGAGRPRRHPRRAGRAPGARAASRRRSTISPAGPVWTRDRSPWRWPDWCVPGTSAGPTGCSGPRDVKNPGAAVDAWCVKLQRCPYDGTPLDVDAYSGGSYLLTCTSCTAEWEAHNSLVRRTSEPDWELRQLRPSRAGHTASACRRSPRTDPAPSPCPDPGARATGRFGASGSGGHRRLASRPWA